MVNFKMFGFLNEFRQSFHIFRVRHDVPGVHLSSAYHSCQFGPVNGVSFTFKKKVEGCLFLHSFLWLALLAIFHLGLLDSVQVRVEWIVAAVYLEECAGLAACHPTQAFSKAVEWKG